jgi:hypothetical protein
MIVGLGGTPEHLALCTTYGFCIVRGLKWGVVGALRGGLTTGSLVSAVPCMFATLNLAAGLIGAASVALSRRDALPAAGRQGL